MSFVRHTTDDLAVAAVDRALKELEFVYLVVVLCTYIHKAWDMSLTYYGDGF